MKKILIIVSIYAGALVESFMLSTGLWHGMAKIKFGQMIAEARGKVAGLVFSRGAYGAYMRQRVTPINPKTVAQGAVRSSLAAASQAWSSLTDAQRLVWASHVDNFKKTNNIGDSVTLTGFNLFVSLNRNATVIGAAPLTAFVGYEKPAAVLTLSGTISHAPEKLEIAFTPAIPAADKWVVYATRPVSEGKNFVKSEFRQIYVMDSADVTPMDLTAAYVALFGAIPQSGEACFVKIRPIKVATCASGGETTGKLK